MTILDNLEKIKKLDKSNMLGSVEALPLQIRQTWEDLKDLKLPDSYKECENILVNGMGGSGLGADLIRWLFYDELPVPFYISHSYDLPGFVNHKTLCILSSYSGNTEETVETAKKALKTSAKLLAFTVGGKLGELVKKYKIPGYTFFEPKYNPCGQPRLSIGYQVYWLLIVLVKLKFLKINQQQIDEVISFLQEKGKKLNVNIPSNANLAKNLAQKIKNKIPVVIAGEFLYGNTHVFCNQLNENAKHFAIFFEIPELNHHLMEGLGHPSQNPKDLIFLLFKSKLYHQQNRKRFEITKKVIQKQKIPVMEIELTGKTKLLQAFELLQLGGYIAFYLAILHQLDPSPIPWVDYFKEQMG